MMLTLYVYYYMILNTKFIVYWKNKTVSDLSTEKLKLHKNRFNPGFVDENFML